MKVVKDLNIGVKPMAGCVCSSGQSKTRGLWDPIWSCKCQCDGGVSNNNANHHRADRA